MQGRDDIARIASARAVEIASRAISLASSVKGEKGDKGDPGEIVLKNVPVPGEKGEQGEKGERGYTGAQGPKGDKGDKGDRGTDAVGAKGDKGDKGETGPQGERGFTGPKGLKGDEGERGLTGPIPKHEIKGLKFRFQQDDGDWGKWIIVPTGGGGGGRDDKLFDRQKELVIIADAYKSNTNPFPSSSSFTTDITVNGLTVGRGDTNIATNTVFGVDALGSPNNTTLNVGNVGIGDNALNAIGNGIGSLTLLSGGSGYDDAYTDSGVDLVYVSGTPIGVNGTLPNATVTISGGQITSVVLGVSGYGWTALDTVFTLDNSAIGGVGSGFTCQIASLVPAINNTALGYNAGTNPIKGSNNLYLGYNAKGLNSLAINSNEIVIGANATGGGNNSVVIGDGSITSTTLRGSVIIPSASISGTLAASGTLNLLGLNTANHSFAITQTTGTITLGGVSGTGAITLGRSTGNQTVNIATGVNGALANKIVNIGTGGTFSNSITSVTIGATGGTGTLTFGQNTGTQTTNIQAGATASGSTKTMNIGTGGLAGSTTNIAIGSTSGTSTTTVNGLLKQQTKTVATLPTGSAGSRSFVTDASLPVFGANVAGGGAVGVPVYHDGTSWKVG